MKRFNKNKFLDRIEDRRERRERYEAEQAKLKEETEKPDYDKSECEHGVQKQDIEWAYSTWRVVDTRCENCRRIDNANEVLNIPCRYHVVGGDSKYVTDFTTNGVLFTGGVGTGKTHELMRLAKTYYIQTGKKPKIEFYGRLMGKIRSGVGNSTYDDIYKEIALSEALIIDDLGVGNDTDFINEFLYNLVNDRYNHMLPLAISTNLNASELGKLYSQRVVSRLTSMCKVVKLEGKDRRIN